MENGNYIVTKEVTLDGQVDRIWNLSWAPSGKLFSSCGDKSVLIWGLEGGKWICKATLDETHQRTIRRTSWSPDSKYLACASFDSTVSVWQFSGGSRGEPNIL